MDWNNWNLNRHLGLLGCIPLALPRYKHTHIYTNKHTHIGIDKYTYVLHCQVFLIPEGSECRNPPTPNLWSTHPQYPSVHPLRKTKRAMRNRKRQRIENEGRSQRDEWDLSGLQLQFSTLTVHKTLHIMSWLWAVRHFDYMLERTLVSLPWELPDWKWSCSKSGVNCMPSVCK